MAEKKSVSSTKVQGKIKTFSDSAVKATGGQESTPSTFRVNVIKKIPLVIRSK